MRIESRMRDKNDPIVTYVSRVIGSVYTHVGEVGERMEGK